MGSKWKFDASCRKVLRALSLRIQELDAHVVSFTESTLADAAKADHEESELTGMPSENARDQLNQAAAALSHIVTKVSVIWKDEITLKELQDTAKSVEESLTTLLQVYKALVALNTATGTWGDMVVVPLQKALQGILFDVRTLVDQFYALKRTKGGGGGRGGNNNNNNTRKKPPVKHQANGAKEKEGSGGEKEKGGSEARPHLTGLVWEGCKRLEGVALDNVTAVARELTKWKETAEDAMKEMKDVADLQNNNNSKKKAKSNKEEEEDAEDGEKEKERRGDANSDDDDDDDDNFDDFGDDDDDEEEEWTEEERALLPGVLVIVRCSYGLLNGLSSLLDRNVTAAHARPSAARAQCAWLKELLARAAGLTRHVDEMGVCVYPPQKRDVIRHNLESLVKHMRDILELVNANEELRANARCVKMGEVVNMMIENAEKQLLPLLTENQ